VLNPFRVQLAFRHPPQNVLGVNQFHFSIWLRVPIGQQTTPESKTSSPTFSTRIFSLENGKLKFVMAAFQSKRA